MSMFNSSSRSRMGSNAITDQSQGGGSKKAGFPYQIGREYGSSIAIRTCQPQNVEFKCCGLKMYNATRFPLACVSRPIGGDVRMVYWKC